MSRQLLLPKCGLTSSAFDTVVPDLADPIPVSVVLHEIQNTEHNPERFLHKTVDGFCLYIGTKLASHTLRLLTKRQFGINGLTVQQP